MLDYLISQRVIGPAGISLAVTVFAFAALWLASLAKRDSSIADRYWAIGFAVVATIFGFHAPTLGVAAMLLLAAVWLWALRLGGYLLARHMSAAGEDPRYAAIRARHSPGFAWKSLPMIFMSQALLTWLIAVPVFAAVLAQGTLHGGLFAVGLAIFAAGFVVEALADWQLARFKANEASSGGLLTSGLWRYSRHPNYAGEAAVWLGLSLMACAMVASPLPLVSALLVALLLICVSGIPPLEAHLSRTRPAFKSYRSRTSAFIPMPPKAQGQRMKAPAE